MADLVVGVDAGATTTRCLVVRSDGTVVGYGVAGGANFRSSRGDPAGNLRAALEGALGSGASARLARVDGAAVSAGVFGIAGAGAAGTEVARAAAARAWRAAGLAGSPRVVTDVEVAFAAGTAAPAGVVLVAGTGAIAAAVEDGRVVRRCDGYGWLLGDEGSAVWLGVRAVRAALAALDGRGPATPLVDAVAGALLGAERPNDVAQALVAAVHREPPAALGALAPLVGTAAAEGDPVAASLVGRAAERLLAAVDAVSGHDGGDPAVVVLAGSLLLTGGPVADTVRAGLSARFAAPPAEAGPGAAGAVALALADAVGERLDPARHAAIVDAARQLEWTR